MSNEAPLRFVSRPTWWTEGLEVSQCDIVKTEQIECESFGKRYSKYCAVLSDGREIACARTSDVLRDAIGFGDAMIEWSIGQTIECIRETLHPWEMVSPNEITEMLERAKKARFRTSEEAAEYGTRAHELIEIFVRNGSLKFETDDGKMEIKIKREPQPVQKSFAAFLDFWESANLEPIAIEKFSVDVKGGYGGTLDLVTKDKNGHIVLIDWKTSKAVRDKYLIQVGAYTRLWETNSTLPIHRAYIVRLDKVTAALQIVTVFDSTKQKEEILDQWQSTLKTYHWLRRAGKFLKNGKW